MTRAAFNNRDGPTVKLSQVHVHDTSLILIGNLKLFCLVWFCYVNIKAVYYVPGLCQNNVLKFLRLCISVVADLALLNTTSSVVHVCSFNETTS